MQAYHKIVFDKQSRNFLEIKIVCDLHLQAERWPFETLTCGLVVNDKEIAVWAKDVSEPDIHRGQACRRV